MQSSNTAALTRLLEDAWPQAYRIAWTILRNSAEAEDAAQEACARALRARDSVRDPSALRSWFYRIVVNESRGRLRKHSDRVIVDEPREVFDAPDDRIDVRRAIDRLDDVSRLSVVLHYYAGLSTAEIAKIIGSSPLAVRLRLLTARRRLRRFLAPDETSTVAERTAHEPQVAK